MKSFIAFLADAYIEETTCNCETCTCAECGGVTEGKKMTPQQKFARHPKIAAIIKKLEAAVKKNKPVAEGSARGAYTRRGTYTKNHQEFLHVAAKSDDAKGLTGHPHEDGRSHSRTHTTPYNKGPSEYEMDKQRAEKLRTPKKQVRVKLPVNPDSKNDRLSHALRWAATKHGAEKK